MNDMNAVIQPKSDQLNADSLQAGPITITITDVIIKPNTEQPITVRFKDDDNKPWKPCKSMARVLVAGWGPDASKYIGRSLTLFRDPSVTWGGMAVGGLRCSHMSHLDGPLTLALTATRGNKKPYKVQPLKAANTEQKPAEPAPTFDWPTYETTVEAMLFDADESLESQWKAMEAERIKARDSDRERAGKIASRVNDKIKELTEAG